MMISRNLDDKLEGRLEAKLTLYIKIHIFIAVSDSTGGKNNTILFKWFLSVFQSISLKLLCHTCEHACAQHCVYIIFKFQCL